MCGLAGFIDLHSQQTRDEKLSALEAMGEAISHRGPDQDGVWLCADDQVGFSHRRLAIIDLSELGSQPMVSSDDRWVIAYNGEVYNYLEIAESLTCEGIKLKGGSDTEVILEAIAHWGLDKSLEMMHGMFAFSLYDTKEKQLSLVRDRMGEKPLYVGIHENKLWFSSELKSLFTAFEAKPELNRPAIGLYLRHGYIPAPHSIYNGVFKLPPAHKLTLNLDESDQWSLEPSNLVNHFQPYWDLKESEKVTIEQTTEQSLQSILEGVISREMRSDVPLGAFLSGGVDSSLIVALAQSESNKRGGEAVKTFSIGFEQEQFNEAPFAEAVASHLKTDHHQQIVTSQDVQSLIPKLSMVYDEPFADSSQMPTILVSQLAKEHVTVSLSGDGGDELFAGYERYQWANDIWNKVQWMPASARQIVAKLIGVLAVLNSSRSPIKLQNIVAKFERLSAMLSSENRQFFYRTLISAGVQVEDYVLGAKELPYCLNQEQLSDSGFIEQMMFLDIHSYLPDDILTKVDRASMSVSLESRVPLLDHSVVEKAWSMRKSIDMSGLSKKPLRDILYQHVPAKLIERPKRGFAVPLADWLRGDLKQWADELLAPDRLQEEAIFYSEKVAQLWAQFKKGKSGSEHLLWSILMFQLWHEQWHK